MNRLNQVINFLGNKYELPIFPLQPFTKIPYFDGQGRALHDFVYNQEQLIDTETLRDFHINNPECNWAIKTGNLSNITILDVDDKQDERGSKFIQKYCDFKPDIHCKDMVKTAHGFHYYFDKTNLLGGNKRYSSVGIDILNGNSYAVLPFSVIKCDLETCKFMGVHEYRFVKSGLNNLPSTTTLFGQLIKTRKQKKSKRKSTPKKDTRNFNSLLTKAGLKVIEKDGKVFGQNISGMHLAWIRKHKRKPLEPQKVFEKPSDNEIAEVISDINLKNLKHIKELEIISNCLYARGSTRKRARAYAKKMGINWKLAEKGGE